MFNKSVKKLNKNLDYPIIAFIFEQAKTLNYVTQRVR